MHPVPATPALGPLHVAALAEAAYVAGAVPQPRRAGAEMLEAVRPLTRHAAGALYGWDQVGERHHPVCVIGYDAATVAGLGDHFAGTHVFRRLHQVRAPLRMDDPPHDFRGTGVYLDVLRPAGFDDGLSVCLFRRDGTYTGLLHLSAEDPRAFGDDVRDLVAVLAPVAARVVDLHGPASAPDALGPDFRGLLVDVDGRTRRVHGREPCVLAENEVFLRRVVARFLAGDRHELHGLWHSAAGWHEVRVHRVPDLVAGRPDAAFVAERPCTLPRRLSPREVDVLTALASGASNPQIAARFVISGRTVTTHVERILEKLGCGTRSGAAALAVREGLVRLDLVGE